MSAYARLVESLLVETQTSTQTTQQDVEDKNKITPIDGRKPKDPEIKIDPEQARKADALKSTGRGRGRQLGRIVRGAGDKGSLARGLARRYASSIEPGSRDKLSKVQSFKRGVDTISKGAVSGVKKALNFGRRIPTGGRSLV